MDYRIDKIYTSFPWSDGWWLGILCKIKIIFKSVVYWYTFATKMLNFNPIPHLFTGKRTLNRLSKFYEVLSYERINRDFKWLMKVYVFIFICFYIIYLPAMEYDPVAELFTVSLHILTFYCKVLLNHPVVFLSFLMGSWYQPILYPNNIDTLLGKIIPLVLYCKRKKKILWLIQQLIVIRERKINERKRH